MIIWTSKNRCKLHKQRHFCSRLFLLPIFTHFIFNFLPTQATIKISFNQIFLFPFFKDKTSIFSHFIGDIPSLFLHLKSFLILNGRQVTQQIFKCALCLLGVNKGWKGIFASQWLYNLFSLKHFNLIVDPK